MADAAALRRSGAAGAAGSGPRTLMLFRGCPRPLGSTILLRSSDAGELRRVKRVASFAAYAAYWGLLESALLADQLASAAAAVLPGGCQPDAVAGLADAVASTSFLTTAEARGRQAILSASPHVSVTLERGAPAEELELPTPDSEQEVAAPHSSGSEEAEAEAASEWDDDEGAASPASSASTQLWVLPAVAGGATFTVSGSQSQTEMDDLDAAAQQQPGAGEGAAGGEALQRANGAGEQRQGGWGGGTPVSAANGTHAQPAPGSPQDPLHLAAKELALQQLQLTGSGPSSPAAAALDAVAAALGQESSEPHQQQQLPLSARGSESSSVAAQPSSQFSGVAAVQQKQQLGSTLGREASWGAASSSPLPPGLLAYCSQQLWLTISCKNPAKGVLCEPAHAHCMQFYAHTGGDWDDHGRCFVCCSSALMLLVWCVGRALSLAKPTRSTAVLLFPCRPSPGCIPVGRRALQPQVPAPAVW